MSDIVKVLRRVVLDAVNAQKPANIVYGTVVSVAPLKVQVDQKLILEREHLKLTRAVMDYEVEMTVDHLTENRAGGSGEAAFASHNHEYKGRKKFLIHNGLIVGDKVTMIRAHGGQQYIIIDKEVV
ncbi:DUF2577 domain-containing protein [Metasolibacillus sp.]|uniref:DUF2577 domain-containing protein n=1 Tax=Metasolibacillus sp. TaxID=2703680 RepID=UPI0025D5DFC2|nr:DUF2577 domain-containing protein [Metasolibacillus sp.]MCT6924108.1 DUF2577 domain-containing protein [Metasolibacillus sp.]MCT6940215.1 DUF2577 domain-containing protein [Metasolibacillus sp.]